jgi:integrase
MASIYPNRKNGKIISFKFKAYLGRDENGKQVFKCTTWIPDKTMSDGKLTLLAEKGATIWERDLLCTIAEEKRTTSPEEITFKDFVEKKWLPTELNNAEHRNSTIAFRHYLLLVIVDYLGEFKLKNIDSTKIEGYLDYLKNTYRTKNNTQVSQQTMRHHYCTLNLIFDYALKLGYMSTNPLVKVKTPKLVKHKVDALSKGEVLAFIKEMDKLPQMQRLMYTLLLTTGVRRGECFGLQWGDIDFDNRIIRIERNVTYTTMNGISVGLPKTNAGIREIPITEGVLLLLTDYKASEAQKFPLLSNAFLFHAESSPLDPRDPTYITKHMKKFMRRVGLPDMSPHDLRHTCASLLLQSGADIKSVQDILGHSNASTTLNFYVRSDMESMRGATDKAFDF